MGSVTEEVFGGTLWITSVQIWSSADWSVGGSILIGVRASCTLIFFIYGLLFVLSFSIAIVCFFKQLVRRQSKKIIAS